ncbi:MAG: DUF4145 domain-containing protein [Acidobacteriota bacterium]
MENQRRGYAFYGLEPLKLTITLWQDKGGLLVPKFLAVILAMPDAVFGLISSPTTYIIGSFELRGLPGDLAALLTVTNAFLWFAVVRAPRRISLRRPSPLGDPGDRFDDDLLDLYVGIKTMIDDSIGRHSELRQLKPTLVELHSSLQKEAYSASLTAAGKVLEAILSAYGMEAGVDLSGKTLFVKTQSLQGKGQKADEITRLKPLLNIVRVYRNLGAHHGARPATRVDVLLALMALAQCLQLVLPDDWLDPPGREIPLSE